MQSHYNAIYNNEARHTNWWTAAGRPFRTTGPDTEKTQSPNVYLSMARTDVH